MQGVIRLLGLLISICFLFLLVIFTISISKRMLGTNLQRRVGRVAVVPISGVILSSSETLKQIGECLKDPSIRAIVVRINSPGGSVGPSQEMYDALKHADQKIPVIISMGSVAASGGYYAALGGRKIFANPGTLTASIGVIMEFANFEGLLTWAKIQSYTLKAGKFKDVGSPFRKMLPQEQELLEALLKDIHDQFRSAVRERRKLTDAELDAVADGRVVSGKQALQVKLVDKLGGFDDAVKEAKRLAKLPESAELLFPEQKSGILKQLIMGDEDSTYEEKTSTLVGSLKSLTAITHKLTSGTWRVLLMAPVAE